MNDLAPISLDASIERFLRLSVADGASRPRTIEAYRANIGYFLAYCKTVGVDPVTASHDDLLAYRASLVGRYARATVRLRLTACRLLYRSLQRWGGRSDSPADGIKAPRNQEGASSAVMAKAVSPEQAKALLAGAGEGRDGALVRLALLLGLRAGELSRATTADISPDGERLAVQGKGGKRRTLVIPYRCRLDLAGLPPGPLFQRRGGGTLSVRSIERAVNKALISVGAKEPGRSTHSLRHGHAILAVMGGAKQEALADALGHSSLNTTFIYTRAAAQLQEAPSDAVERMLK